MRSVSVLACVIGAVGLSSATPKAPDEVEYGLPGRAGLAKRQSATGQGQPIDANGRGAPLLG